MKKRRHRPRDPHGRAAERNSTAERAKSEKNGDRDKPGPGPEAGEQASALLSALEQQGLLLWWRLRHPPGPRQAGLHGLQRHRQRWTARHAARRALFSRPTPVAHRLLAVARVRRTTVWIQLSAGTLIWVHFTCLLLGLEGEHWAMQAMDWALGWMLHWLEPWLPLLSSGPYRLSIAHLLVLVLLYLGEELLTRLTRRMLYSGSEGLWVGLPPPGASFPSIPSPPVPPPA